MMWVVTLLNGIKSKYDNSLAFVRANEGENDMFRIDRQIRSFPHGSLLYRWIG